MDADTARLVGVVLQTVVIIVTNTIGFVAVARKLDTKLDRKDYEADHRILNMRIASKADRAA